MIEFPIIQKNEFINLQRKIFLERRFKKQITTDFCRGHEKFRIASENGWDEKRVSLMPVTKFRIASKNGWDEKRVSLMPVTKFP